MTQPLPMSYQADDGATWTFDPASQKWTASFNGQKASSQKYEALTAKVARWTAPPPSAKPGQPARVPDPQVFTFGMAKSFTAGHSSDVTSMLSLAIPPKENEGVTIKTSWDPAKEQFEIVRFRQWSATPQRRESGWESNGSDHLSLINFDALDEDDQAWWRELFVARAQVRLADAARRTISAAWLATKPDITAFYDVAGGRYRQDSVPDLIPGQRPASEYGNSSWALMKGCPVTSAHHLGSSDGWTRDDQGQWANGTVRLGFKATSSTLPKFIVQTVDEAGQPSTLWEGSSFFVAMALANATVRAIDEQRPVLNGWSHTAERNGSTLQGLGLGLWPTEMSAQSAVFAMEGQDHRQAELYVLGQNVFRSNHSLLLGRPATYGLSSKNEGFGWQKASAEGLSYHVLPVGPEDAVYAVAQDLDAAIVQTVAPFVQADERDAFRQRLQRQTQATIKAAYDLAGDGETLSEDPTFMVNRWQDTVTREEARAAKHPSVTAFAQQCDAMVERATLLLTDLGHTPQAPKAMVSTVAKRTPR